MKKEKIALHFALNSLDKLRVENAIQVATIFNAIYSGPEMPPEESRERFEPEKLSLKAKPSENKKRKEPCKLTTNQ